MGVTDNKQNDQAAIKRLLDNLIRSLRNKDIDGVMSTYAPEVVTFDIVGELQYLGADALRELWEDAFAFYQGPIEYKIDNLSITVGDDVAFSYSLNRIGGTLPNGQKSEMWLRWTACFRKIGGKWLIVHHQNSVPADLEHGKAVVDLKP